MRAASVRLLCCSLALLPTLACHEPTAPAVPPASVAPLALCAAPAPLHGTFTPAAPRIIVQLKPGIPVEPEVARLAHALGFTPSHVYTHALEGFSATVPDSTVAALRCEGSVLSVGWETIGTIG